MEVCGKRLGAKVQGVINTRGQTKQRHHGLKNSRINNKLQFLQIPTKETMCS